MRSSPPSRPGSSPTCTAAINRAAAAGWINGYADGTFRPNAYITRAEAVTLINRMLDRAPDANHLLADMVRWPDNPETAWYYADIQEATNSHDYTRAGTGNYEVWTELLANRERPAHTRRPPSFSQYGQMVSTFSRLVLPDRPLVMPPVMTISSPGESFMCSLAAFMAV